VRHGAPHADRVQQKPYSVFAPVKGREVIAAFKGAKLKESVSLPLPTLGVAIRG